MSEHITHVAVFDDSVRLVKYSGRFTAAFMETLSNEFDTGFLTSGTYGNHLWAVPLLEECRKKYKDGDRSRETYKKIAASIGWLTHRAADLVVKPILANVLYENNPLFNDVEQSAYYDTVAFRETFRGGKLSITPLEPFSPALFEEGMKSHPAAASLDINELEIPASNFYLNEILKNHAFVEDESNIDAWFDLFMESKQIYSEDLNQYINGFQHPDKVKTDKYIVNFNYYNPTDPIIKLVRSIQAGSPDKSIGLEVALDAAFNQSQYAKMLADSYMMLRYASDFFDAKIEKKTMYDLLNMEEEYRK